MAIHPTVAQVTARIRERSATSRNNYLARMASATQHVPARSRLSCANAAHGFAAAPASDKVLLKGARTVNIGIVTSYNDMLSAHQPYADYPAQIKVAARGVGATAQVAGGVPAMCDGITQGRDGMELSLFSRDVIALATGVALSHEMFDAVLYLGICDKIVPGLLMGALSFGHLPAIFVPAGPMPSGISNGEKSRVRQAFAAGKVSRAALLEAEASAYHAPGTCTFYGTANSNQMLMEIMGLHLPGAAFVPPHGPLRAALTARATERAAAITALGAEYIPIGEIVNERAIVNAIVGLLATGGSTNHTIHLVAIARAAGIVIDWNDFSDLSDVVPLLARIYPSGNADVNDFHAAGGVAFVIRQLIEGGFLHEDVQTVCGAGLSRYTEMPMLKGADLTWTTAPGHSGDPAILRAIDIPFSPDGGLKLLAGNLGRAVMKVSAVDPGHRVVRAPARVFDNQAQVLAAAQAGELSRDVVVVVRFQGPCANGMPELHQLVPTLANLQDQGYRVALVTDGRMSGASGKVPAAIHVSPEAMSGGPLARVRDGDIILVDVERGVLAAEVPEPEWAARANADVNSMRGRHGSGRELFGLFRASVTGAEDGAAVFGFGG